MSIDWFTFAAQILNFLLLVWLMKRFLYGPIVDAMEQREERVANRMSDAAEAEKKAIDTQRKYDAMLADLANSREELLLNAGRETEAWRDEQMRMAKEEVDHSRTQWHQTLARDKQSLLRAIQLDAAAHATDLSRHLLKELADERLQSRFVTRFVSLLQNANGNDDKAIRSIAVERSIVIETSHPLSDQEQSKMEDALREFEQFSGDLEFRVNPQLVCGIEIRTSGGKLAWSIRDSLAELESDIIDSIDEVIPSQAAARSGISNEQVAAP